MLGMFLHFFLNHSLVAAFFVLSLELPGLSCCMFWTDSLTCLSILFFLQLFVFLFHFLGDILTFTANFLINVCFVLFLPMYFFHA